MKTFKGTKFTWKNLPSYSKHVDIVAGGGTLIARVKPRDIQGEAEANAKLIAASKELLEALQDAIKRMDRCRGILTDSNFDWNILNTKSLTKAINKAL